MKSGKKNYLELVNSALMNDQTLESLLNLKVKSMQTDYSLLRIIS